ncbi:MAG: polysaccharide biosynthesis/export family protein [Bacteroidota bacterium]
MRFVTKSNKLIAWKITRFKNYNSLRMVTINKYVIVSFLVMLVCCSCQPSKKMHESRLYLQGIDSANIMSIHTPVETVQQGDLLSITVFSDNPEATAIYNQVQAGSAGAIATASSAGTNSGGGRGYLVDNKGNILFHGLGVVHAEGLSKPQLSDVLLQKLDTFLKHPYIEIRFINKRVTMLGEVAKPGIINMPEERINIFDALAFSGDITNFGRRDNILVIREDNGKRTMGRLNIRDANIYKSDYFYLHSGDLVYIEPIRKKPLGTDANLVRNISLATTIVSLLAILYSIFRNN